MHLQAAIEFSGTCRLDVQPAGRYVIVGRMGIPQLREVHTRIDQTLESGVLPLVVFDLDSTLFSTEPRNLQIFREFARERVDKYPELEPLLASVRREHMGWNIHESLRSQGLENEALLSDLKRFWSERFFTDDYVLCDDPMPGAVDYVTSVYDRGAMVYYLTGRHAGGMELGTVRALRKAGFPYWRGRTTLHLKPSFAMTDRDFKDEALAEIRSYRGRVVATFENEPGNANLFLDAFPSALHFLLLTVCSTEAEEPAPELLKTLDFTVPPVGP